MIATAFPLDEREIVLMTHRSVPHALGGESGQGREASSFLAQGGGLMTAWLPT